jgi:hypothetical protein
MEGAIYLLCAAAALGCALLLLRGYWRSKVRLLLWSSLFFFAFTLENVILFVDLVVVPEIDLSAIWLSTSLLGTSLLLYGLVWEEK